MAKKHSSEETITERIEACARSTAAAKRRIEEHVEKVRELESSLPNVPELIALFRTSLAMILHETKYL